MNIRDALINQQPSLAGWREAQAEIARLDADNEQKAKWIENLLDSVSADLENGVKWINEIEAEKFHKTYPRISEALKDAPL